MLDILGDEIPDPQTTRERRAAFVDREMSRLTRDVDPLGGGIAAYRQGLQRSNEWWDAVREFAAAERISDRQVIEGLLDGHYGMSPAGLRRARFTTGDAGSR